MKSMRRRLVLWIASSAFIIVAVTCAAVWHINSQQLYERLDKSLEQASDRNDRRFVFEYIWNKHWKKENPDDERPQRNQGRYAFVLYNEADNKIFHHSDHLSSAEATQLVASNKEQWQFAKINSLQEIRTFTRELDTDLSSRFGRNRRMPSFVSELPKSLAFMTITSLKEVEEQLDNLALVLTLVTCISTICCAIAAAIIGSSTVKPITRLSQRIAEIDAHKLDQHVEPDLAAQELQPIVESLNQSLKHISDSFVREKQLTADLAHELRTPLAAIRSEIEQLRHQDHNPSAQQQLDNAFFASTQMQSLTERILLMARLESGIQVTEAHSIDIADEINDRFARLPQARLELENNISLSAFLVCDQTLFRMVIDNVMNNANEYASAGTLHITNAVTDGQLQIAITNHIDQDTEIDCEAIFTPYWRADSARSRTGSHAGLGLPLVKRMMACMHGSTWASVDETTSTFTLHLSWPHREDESSARLAIP